jgi:hypothetical protein
MNIFKWFKTKKSTNLKIESKIESDYEKKNDAICPNCNVTLKKIPLRKTKCFSCKENIYILKFNNYQEKRLVTENEKSNYEVEARRLNFRKRWFAELKRFGIKEHDIYTRKNEYFKKSGIENNDNDVIWSLFNELLSKNSTNFNQLGVIYYSMALYLREEGKDNFYLLVECAKATLLKLELESLDSNLVQMVHVISGSNSCDNCKKLGGLQMTFKDALMKMPIPCRECNHSIGFCRCMYGVAGMRDRDGVLIYKN